MSQNKVMCVPRKSLKGVRILGVGIVALFFFSALNCISNAAAAGPQTWTSADPQKSITDYHWTNSFIAITMPGTITDVDAKIIDIHHTYDADMKIYLIHPDGTNITLSLNNGGSGDNYINTIFDSEASTSIKSGSPPFTGSYQPEGTLTALNNKALNGLWKLSIYDGGPGDSGYLAASGWSLIITYTPLNTPPGTPVLDSKEQMDNALVPTTTPKLKWFVPEDAEHNELHFQIQVGLKPDFATPLFSRSSSTDPGFGGDPDNTPPYVSGSGSAWYIVQTGDGLTNGNTYWWHVRAHDGTSYGSWSEGRSFTVDTSISITAWRQTTKEQFDKDDLVQVRTRPGPDNDVVLGGGGGTITIAPGPNAESRTPLDIYYKYHCDGALYIKDEIGGGGTMTKIRWNRSTASVDTIKYVTIYMQETTVSDLSGTGYDTCAKLQAGTLVFSGNITLDGTTKNWYPEVTLSTPFQYSGTKNLIVSVRHQTGSYEVDTSWYLHSSIANMFRTGSSYSSNPPATIGLSSYRPNIQFDIISDHIKVTIDPVGTNAESRTPLDIYYKYHCDGALYTKGEIGVSGTITKLRWNRSTASVDAIKYVTIYMQEATVSDLSGTGYDTCAKLQAGTLVFSGNLTLNGTTKNWYPEVTLSTPFQYSGTKNLILSVRHQTGSYEVDTSWYLHSSISNMFRTGSSYSSNPPATIGLSSYRPNIQFDFTVFPSGTIISTPINYGDNPDAPIQWEEVTWSETSGGGTSDITVKVQYWDGANWVDIPGKSSTDSPIYLYDSNTSTYNKIRLVAILDKGNRSSPELKDWSVTWASTTDSDNDGLTDWQEIYIYKTNPHNPDSDSDGLNDGAEVSTYHTDPLNPDTDQDGLNDGWEVSNNLDPLVPLGINNTISGALNHTPYYGELNGTTYPLQYDTVELTPPNYLEVWTHYSGFTVDEKVSRLRTLGAVNISIFPLVERSLIPNANVQMLQNDQDLSFLSAPQLASAPPIPIPIPPVEPVQNPSLNEYYMGEPLPPNMITTNIIFDNSLSEQSRIDLIRSLDGTHISQMVDSYGLYPTMRAMMPTTKIEELRLSPGVRSVDIPQGGSAFPFGQTIGDATKLIGADKVWKHTTGYRSYNVGPPMIERSTIAIIDSGANYLHEDLIDSFKDSVSPIAGYDFVENDFDPMVDLENGGGKESDHGTYVASVAGMSDNDKGYIGVAPNARLYALRVTRNYEDAYVLATNAINALYWAQRNHINIAVMSWGVTQDFPGLATAISDVKDSVLLITASGEPRGVTWSYPQLYHTQDINFINVGGVEKNDYTWFESTYGPQVDILALSTSVDVACSIQHYKCNPSGYGSGDGTSFSAPAAAGVAALLMAQHPQWPVNSIKTALIYTARPHVKDYIDPNDFCKNPGGKSNEYGWGIVQASPIRYQPLGINGLSGFIEAENTGAGGKGQSSGVTPVRRWSSDKCNPMDFSLRFNSNGYAEYAFYSEDGSKYTKNTYWLTLRSTTLSGSLGSDLKFFVDGTVVGSLKVPASWGWKEYDVPLNWVATQNEHILRISSSSQLYLDYIIIFNRITNEAERYVTGAAIDDEYFDASESSLVIVMNHVMKDQYDYVEYEIPLPPETDSSGLSRNYVMEIRATATPPIQLLALPSAVVYVVIDDSISAEFYMRVTLSEWYTTNSFPFAVSPGTHNIKIYLFDTGTPSFKGISIQWLAIREP